MQYTPQIHLYVRSVDIQKIIQAPTRKQVHPAWVYIQTRVSEDYKEDIGVTEWSQDPPTTLDSIEGSWGV